eukprot:990715-Prymnesium_polylepis.1
MVPNTRYCHYRQLEEEPPRTTLCENLPHATPWPAAVSAGRERARACGSVRRAFAPFLRLRHPYRSPP